ncbi:MAG: InlB B-repeat-containing protein, partial [Acholeplasmataceae bacterium]
MKKLITTLLFINLLFVLVGCDRGEVITYQVDFVTNGGTAVESVVVDSGTLINEPDSTKEGFISNGWYTESTFLSKWNFTTDTIVEDTTLYILWVAETEPEMSISDLVQSLLSTPYTNNELETTYGLNDVANVGVNEDEKTVIYETISDTQYESNAVFDFESLKSSQSLDDTATWDYVITQAKLINEQSDTPVKIKLPNREINIIAGQSTTAVENYSLTLQGFDNLHIVGGDQTVLMIDVPSVWKGGLLIDESSNIQINNVKIDYKYSPTLTGIIKSYDTDNLTMTMDIPASMHETVKHYKDVPELAETLYSFIEYNMFTGGPKEGGNVLIYSQGFFKSVELIENDGTELDQIIVEFTESYRSSFETPRINDRVALGFAMYGNNGITVNNSNDIIFESSGIYTAPGMGLTANYVNNLFINNFEIVLKDDRLMTTTADGMHIANSTGKVEITNSIIENTHDDALNIKSGYYYSLSSVDAVSRTITLSKKTSSIPMPEVGDIIQIYGSSDFDLRASLTVEEVSGNTSTMIIKVAERLSGTVDWTDAVATNVSFSAKLLFKNNIVRNKRNRGILVQVREAIIENNTFENIGHGSIQVASSLDIFNEATMPDNITIQNNKFINNGYLLNEALRGDISVFAIAEGGNVAPSGTISNISIYNNFIANTANTGISLRGVGGDSVFVEENLFYNTARVYSSNLTEAAMELVNVEGISIINNYNYYTLGSLTYSGIIPAGLTKTDSILLEGNTNLNYQTSDGEVQTYYVSSILDSDIIIDGDVSEWDGKGTDIIIDGSSLATGDEISETTYYDVFHVNMAKISHSETGIYFAFDIFDDTLEFKTINDFWIGDVIEIFLSTYLDSPNADFMLYKEESDVFQLALAESWSSQFWFAQSRTSTSIIENKNLVEVSFVITDDGWAGEVFIPFTVIPDVQTMINQQEGIAIAVVFADAERLDINRTRLQIG